MGQGRYHQRNIDVQSEGQDVESLGVGTHFGEQALGARVSVVVAWDGLLLIPSEAALSNVDIMRATPVILDFR